MNSAKVKISFTKKTIEVTPPAIQEKEITAGLPLYYLVNDVLPVINTRIYLKLKNRKNRGIYDILSQMLFEGTEEISAIEFHDSLEYLGSHVYAGYTHDSFFIHINSLTANFEQTVSLVWQAITRPRFEDKDFERVKDRMLVTMKQYKDDSGAIAEKALTKKVFREKESPFDYFSASYDLIKNITKQDVKEELELIKTESKAVSLAVGAIDISKLSEILINTFGSVWNVATEVVNNTTKYKQYKSCITVVHKDGAEQVELRMGQEVEYLQLKDRLPVIAAAEILGGQFSSRLNKNLREKHGFTYGISAYYGFGKETGVFMVSSAIETKNIGKAVVQTQKEMLKIKQDIKSREVFDIKLNYSNSYCLGFETNFRLFMQLESFMHSGYDKEEYLNYAKRVKELNKENMLEAIQKNLDLDNLQIVLVGDKKQIMKSLKKVPLAGELEFLSVDEVFGY